MSSVNNPNHYNTRKELVLQNEKIGLQAIDVIDHFGFCFNIGNAFKYMARAGRKDSTLKGELEDLEKAIWYMNNRLRLVKQSINRNEK